MNKSVINLMNDIHAQVTAHEPASKIINNLHDCVHDHLDSHCAFPKVLKVTDSFTGQIREILVPCGHCHYCRQKKVGEWSSRMILQTLYCSKYAYFVTLTYRSFDNYDDIPKVLHDAYWHYDNINSEHRWCFSPCLLRHEHVQRFMKYLRKHHGADKISFFVGSEYGSDYGRPHHHLILWSNEPISHLDVYRAWSYRVPHSKLVVTIGKVDYNDLNANGTIVADGINFGHDLHKCFRYVAKYICKGLLSYDNAADMRSRLNIFMNDLRLGLVCDCDMNAVFNDRVRGLVSLYRDWADHFSDHVREKECRDWYDYFKSRGSQFQILYPKFKSHFYDFETSPFMYQFHRDDLVSSDELQSVLRDWYLKFSPILLRKVFKPCCQCSRNSGIASEYFSRHVADYTSGNFVLPTYDGKSLLLPSYFFRKTKEYLLRYVQFRNVDASSATHSPRVLANPLHYKDFFGETDFFCDSCNPFAKVLPKFSVSVLHNIQSLLRSDFAFYDYRTNCRCLAFLSPDMEITIECYVYNRSNRKYELCDSMTFHDFIEKLTDVITRYIPFHDKYSELADISLSEYYLFVEQMDMYINSFCDDVSLMSLSSYDVFISESYDRYLKSILYVQDTKDSIKVKPTNNLQ